MSTLFECLMVSAFCISIALQLCRYIRSGTKASKKRNLYVSYNGNRFYRWCHKNSFLFDSVGHHFLWTWCNADLFYCIVCDFQRRGQGRV